MKLFFYFLFFFTIIITNVLFVSIAWSFLEDAKWYSVTGLLLLTHVILPISMDTFFVNRFKKWKREFEIESMKKGINGFIDVIGDRNSDKQFHGDVSIKSVPIRDWEGKNMGTTTVYQEICRKKEEYFKNISE
jgi:hypothetical protein